jgi:hypothetical protein
MGGAPARRGDGRGGEGRAAAGGDGVTECPASRERWPVVSVRACGLIRREPRCDPLRWPL